MKKILIIFSLLIGISSVYALNVSFSDNGFGMDADLFRVGDNVRMRYKINGVSSALNATSVSPENRADLSSIGNMNFDVLVSCSEHKMKVLSMEIYGLDGNLVQKISGGDWVPVEKAEDIKKFEEICNRI